MTALSASFLQSVVDYFKDNPLYFYILLAIAVLLIIVIVALIVSACKKRRHCAADKNEEAEAVPAAQETVSQPSAAQETETVSQGRGAVSETGSEGQEPPADDAQTAASEPTPAPAEEAQTAAPEAEEDADKKQAAQRSAAQRKPRVLTEAERARRQIIYSGKWVIRQNEEGGFRFELRASNGERLLGSNDYSTVQGAKSGIKTYKSNIDRDNFVIAQSKGGQFYFKLLSGSKQLLCTGETYSTRTSCENAIESVKRFSATAQIALAADDEE